METENEINIREILLKSKELLENYMKNIPSYENDCIALKEEVENIFQKAENLEKEEVEKTKEETEKDKIKYIKASINNISKKSSFTLSLQNNLRNGNQEDLKHFIKDPIELALWEARSNRASDYFCKNNLIYINKNYIYNFLNEQMLNVKRSERDMNQNIEDIEKILTPSKMYSDLGFEKDEKLDKIIMNFCNKNTNKDILKKGFDILNDKSGFKTDSLGLTVLPVYYNVCFHSIPSTISYYFNSFNESKFDKIENFLAFKIKVEEIVESFTEEKSGRVKIPEFYVDFFQKLSAQEPEVFNKALTLFDFARKYPLTVFDKNTYNCYPYDHIKLGQKETSYEKTISDTEDRNIANITIMGQWLAYQNIEDKDLREKVGYCLKQRRYNSNSIDKKRTVGILENLKDKGFSQDKLIEMSITVGQMYINLLTAFVTSKSLGIEDKMFDDFQRSNYSDNTPFKGENFVSVFVNSVKQKEGNNKNDCKKSLDQILESITSKEMYNILKKNNINVESILKQIDISRGQK